MDPGFQGNTAGGGQWGMDQTFQQNQFMPGLGQQNDMGQQMPGMFMNQQQGGGMGFQDNFQMGLNQNMASVVSNPAQSAGGIDQQMMQPRLSINNDDMLGNADSSFLFDDNSLGDPMMGQQMHQQHKSNIQEMMNMGGMGFEMPDPMASAFGGDMGMMQQMTPQIPQQQPGMSGMQQVAASNTGVMNGMGGPSPRPLDIERTTTFTGMDSPALLQNGGDPFSVGSLPSQQQQQQQLLLQHGNQQGAVDVSAQYWEQLTAMRNEHMEELSQFYQVLSRIANKQPQSERAKDLKDRSMVFRQRLKEAIDRLNMDPSDPVFKNYTFTAMDLERLQNLNNDIRINMERMREERMQKLLRALEQQPVGDGQGAHGSTAESDAVEKAPANKEPSMTGSEASPSASSAGQMTPQQLQEMFQKQILQAKQHGATDQQLQPLLQQQKLRMQALLQQQAPGSGTDDGQGMMPTGAARGRPTPEQLRMMQERQLQQAKMQGATDQQIMLLKQRFAMQMRQLMAQPQEPGGLNSEAAGNVSRPTLTPEQLTKLQEQQVDAARKRGASHEDIEALQQRHRQQQMMLQQKLQQTSMVNGGGSAGGGVGGGSQPSEQQLMMFQEQQLAKARHQGATEVQIQALQQRHQQQLAMLRHRQLETGGTGLPSMQANMPESNALMPDTTGLGSQGGAPSRASQLSPPQLRMLQEQQLQQAKAQGATDQQIMMLKQRHQQQMMQMMQSMQQGAGPSSGVPGGSPQVTPQQLAQLHEKQLQAAQQQGVSEQQLQLLRQRQQQQMAALHAGGNRPASPQVQQQLAQMHERQIQSARQQGASEEQIQNLKQRQQQQMAALQAQSQAGLSGPPSLPRQGSFISSKPGSGDPSSPALSSMSNINPQQLKMLHDQQLKAAQDRGLNEFVMQGLRQKQQQQMAALLRQQQQQQMSSSPNDVPGMTGSMGLAPGGTQPHQPRMTMQQLKMLQEQQIQQATSRGFTEQQLAALKQRHQQQAMQLMQQLGGAANNNTMGAAGTQEQMAQIQQQQLQKAQGQSTPDDPVQMLQPLNQVQQNDGQGQQANPEQDSNAAAGIAKPSTGSMPMASSASQGSGLRPGAQGNSPITIDKLKLMQEQQLKDAQARGATEEQMTAIKDRHQQQLKFLQMQEQQRKNADTTNGSDFGSEDPQMMGFRQKMMAQKQHMQQVHQRQMAAAQQQGASEQQLQVLLNQQQQQLMTLDQRFKQAVQQKVDSVGALGATNGSKQQKQQIGGVQNRMHGAAAASALAAAQTQMDKGNANSDNPDGVPGLDGTPGGLGAQFGDPGDSLNPFRASGKLPSISQSRMTGGPGTTDPTSVIGTDSGKKFDSTHSADDGSKGKRASGIKSEDTSSEKRAKTDDKSGGKSFGDGTTKKTSSGRVRKKSLKAAENEELEKESK